MTTDYPRLNQFPEWFTVKAEDRNNVDGTATSGEILRAGLPVKVDGKAAVHLTLHRAP